MIQSCKTFRNSTFRLFATVSFPDIDLDYYCNLKNATEINENIHIRKGVGNINRVLETYKIFQQTPATDASYSTIKKDLYKELSRLPNKTHPSVKEYKEEPLCVHKINNKRCFGDYKPLEFSDITRRLNLMRTDKLGQTCGHKSYYFLGELAELEEALIKYTVKSLLCRGFQLVSVPDILPSNILESCGMTINSDRTQIYSLDPMHHGSDLYLSGTAEMSLAGLLMNTLHDKQKLPLKLAAVSRCYRAETSNLIEERGIYSHCAIPNQHHCYITLAVSLNMYPNPALVNLLPRVHQFTKVEMFAVTTPEQSDNMLEYLRRTEEELFTPLGFHMKVLDMPPFELGAPAYRKYDIEAWMPGRNSYGEVSSCSNCTDYQSRRLHIKYSDGNITRYVHTLNGTACAVPRMMIALLETHQDPKGKILIPEVLQPYMGSKKYITKNNRVPELKLLKVKK